MSHHPWHHDAAQCRSYLEGKSSISSPFTADYNWKEAPSPFTSQLTEQIIKLFRAYGKTDQSPKAAKQLAADLLWILPPPGEPTFQQGSPAFAYWLYASWKHSWLGFSNGCQENNDYNGVYQVASYSVAMHPRAIQNGCCTS